MLTVTAAEEGLTIGDFQIARSVAEWIEVIAIFAISLSVVMAIVAALATRRGSDWDASFDQFKRHMARGLLIGLDLLIAADIIKTVTLEPNVENAVVLALLVLIRTFLSWTLILEVRGRWPWQSEA